MRLFPTVALLRSTPPLTSTFRRKNPCALSLGEGLHRSLSFAMQRVCVQTKRFIPATNSAAEFALNNFGAHVLAGMKSANALTVRASRNGNNAATAVSQPYVPGRPRGHLATICGV